MTNIKEIARRAGVSPSTVSRALSGKGYVSEEKKRRVLAVAEEFDYAPNLNALSLKTGITRRLGLQITEDFAVCGFDNLDFADTLDLTTIHYPVKEQAGNAFSIIRNRIEQINLPLRPLKFHLVQRSTT